MKTLTFRSSIFAHLAWHLLNGFRELETLSMLNVTINSADPHLLDALEHSIRTIVISEFSELGTGLKLSVFTGGTVEKSYVKSVHVRYNIFERTIRANTFEAIDGVEILVLAGCQIEVIERKAFHQLSFLERLNLNDNRLQTIADGLFDELLPSYHLYIYMHDNPWTCGCEVCYLKTTLSDYWWSFSMDDDICDEPSTRGGLDADHFCSSDTCNEPIDAPPVVSTTTPATTKPTVDRDSHCALQDYPPSLVVDVVKITLRNRIFRIQDNHDGTVNVTVQKHALQTNLLVWFDNSEKHSQSVLPATIVHDERCRQQLTTNNSVEQTVRLEIRAQVPYTFCVMTNITEQYLVSPFNCVSYQKTEAADSDVWFRKEARTFIVTMLALGIVLIFIVGLILGYWMLRKCRCCRKRVCGKDAEDGEAKSSSRNV